MARKKHNKPQKEKLQMSMKEIMSANDLNDDAVDRLTGAIIKQALDDLFVDVNALKNAYLSAEKDRQSAVTFFKERDGLFSKTNLDLDYLVKHYFVYGSKSGREQGMRLLKLYPRCEDKWDLMPLIGVLSFVELQLQDKSRGKEYIKLMRNVKFYLQDYQDAKRELKKIKDEKERKMLERLAKYEEQETKEEKKENEQSNNQQSEC